MQSELPQLFSGLTSVEEHAGQVSMSFQAADPLAVATAFRQLGARLLTIARLKEGWLHYVFEIVGRLYLVQLPSESPLKSLRRVFPASEWHEAYLGALYGLTFDPASELFHLPDQSEPPKDL
jgi:hypothetical protein